MFLMEDNRCLRFWISETHLGTAELVQTKQAEWFTFNSLSRSNQEISFSVYEVTIWVFLTNLWVYKNLLLKKKKFWVYKERTTVFSYFYNFMKSKISFLSSTSFFIIICWQKQKFWFLFSNLQVFKVRKYIFSFLYNLVSL